MTAMSYNACQQMLIENACLQAVEELGETQWAHNANAYSLGATPKFGVPRIELSGHKLAPIKSPFWAQVAYIVQVPYKSGNLA